MVKRRVFLKREKLQYGKGAQQKNEKREKQPFYCNSKKVRKKEKPAFLGKVGTSNEIWDTNPKRTPR